MPYIYPTANLLEGKPRVGKGECVELVRHYAKVPHSSTWKPGEQVWGNKTLKPGTAIATFINGRYPGWKTGNHAAFYIGQTSQHVYIMDQWNSGDRLTIRRRTIKPLKVFKDGSFERASDNALAFRVIE